MVVKQYEKPRADTKAAKFVDDTAVFRVLGAENAAEFGVTTERIQKQIKGLAAEPLFGCPEARYSKFVTFSDGSCAAQVIGSRRWEVWG